ncbi:MAG TPA: molybdopterin cofactor-binding domain-containing protein [Gammaproteobacteria bacterium]|nr:molybdopterin cofactor-binding domain-containing protein [Gammaproteobacteria bacterium]
MSAHLEVGRRQFLKLSVLAGGGLLLGIELGGSRANAAETGEFKPNAWVRVGADGRVSLVCPRNEMGQDVRTSLTMLLAEELAVDPLQVALEEAPPDPVYINKLMGSQITGGSTSMRDAWEPLRRAGATARTLLVSAAAERWQVSPGECRASGGRVAHGDESLSYGELAAAAARLPVPKDVPLKSAGEFDLIGTALPRLDGADKARGKTIFGIDVRQPGMVYAALATCPVLGGRVASFDATAAQKRSGVRKVVDLGEGVAVIADHYWIARSALADIKIQWDEGARAALDNAAIYATLEKAKDRPGAIVRQAGDAAAALAKTKPIEARYTAQMLAHMTLEPPNCLALVSPRGVDVWASTQFPQGAQAIAAQKAQVPPEQVRVHAQFIGGGFGRRLDVDFIGQAVAIAKSVAGVPVQLIWTREDDVTHDFYRPPSLHLLSAALESGRIAAFAYKMISPSITNRMFPGAVKDGLDGFMTEGIVDFRYDIPNLDMRTVIQEVGIDVGYWRSVSNSLNAFAIESFVDELAHAAGQDPVQFRLSMLGGQPRLRAVIERAAKEAGFEARPSSGRAFGVASMECYDSRLALVAELSGTGDRVKLEKLTYAVDCGIAVHPDQVIAQIESGAVSGLINTLRSKVTIKNGRVEQSNFDSFRIPRMPEVPPIKVSLVSSDASPGGIGEAGVPLVAPAIANALFGLTGKRVRALPLEDAGVTFTS